MLIRVWMVAFAALMAVTSVGAEAQDAPGATQEHLARTFREQGVESARSGNWDSAREQFQRSYDLDPRILTVGLTGPQSLADRACSPAQCGQDGLCMTGDNMGQPCGFTQVFSRVAQPGALPLLEFTPVASDL